ncbi:MAG TPA: nitrate- and nitrite sensing domain-containing protein [Acidimicrobiales bacterium]
MGRRIPIRVKVAAALAVPLLALVVGAAVGVSTSTSQARTVTRQAELATASIGHAGLINVLQNERNTALVQMLGLGALIDLEQPDVDVSRQRTNDAHDALHRQISGQDDRLREDWANALSTLDGLPALRAAVDAAVANPGPANREAAHEVFAEYTDMVATIFASHDRFALVVDDSDLRQGDDLVHYSSHATDSVAQLVDQLLYVGWGTGGIDEPVDAAEVSKLARDVEKNNAVVKTKGTGDYAAAADRLLADPQVEGLVPFASDAIASGAPLDPVALLATTPLGADGPYLAFRDQVADVLERRANDLESQADARRRWYVGAALAAVIVAVLVAWRVSRSITRPLRALSHDAQSMAEEQLPSAVAGILDAPWGQELVPPEPAPIKVTTSDEVSDVAHALDDVQRSALGLAVEQATLRRTIAESYVNLGRRNQNLLSRLLDAVGDLEQGETDPERIAQLHKLDHLATRMRRNAESLLVLSEADVGPRWHPPVRVLDVVRAALGEIENYQRVVVRTLDPVMILGGAASDLTHLLAELIENGVKHSPPHELVEIRGRATSDGYSLAVIDHGLGMSAADIAQANQRLAGAEPPTVALSKHLGHFVAAALAARNGITVRLQGSEVVGIAAIVELPPAIIAATPPDPVRELVAPAAPAAPPAPEALVGTPSGLRAPVGSAAAPDWPPVPPPPPPVERAPADAPAAPASVPVPSPIPVGGGTPAVTASGLVRRVRGAQHPGASGPLSPVSRSPSIRPAAAVDDRQPGVDPAEIQRFLSSLASGVQRSLADTDRGRDRESQ